MDQICYCITFDLLAYHGRWLYNVTYITEDMWDEVRCRKFHENATLRQWTRDQLVNAFPCPCYEQRMREVRLDPFWTKVTLTQNDSLN